MRQEDFKSTVLLEKDTCNRKVNADGEKVEWMKIQWIKFVKDKSYIIPPIHHESYKNLKKK